MGLYASIKNALTTREAAERYGIRVSRNGMCRCPFHPDRNPSMKVDERFHCFGCQADGDVISFASRLFDLSPREAALKLAADFGIAQNEPEQASARPGRRPHRASDLFDHQVGYCFHELAAYRDRLLAWKETYAPKSHHDDFHPRFLEALTQLDQVEAQMDMLLTGTLSEKQEVIRDFLREQKKRMKEAMDMEPKTLTPVYHESSAYAREHGELESFRLSHQANLDCKRAIQDAISRYFDGWRLDKKAALEILEQFGMERTTLVLAATVQDKSWDGRFSSSNKDWAFSVSLPQGLTDGGMDRRHDYAVSSHPAILDGFIWQVRKEIREREHPEPRADTSLPLTPAAKEIKKKALDMER